MKPVTAELLDIFMPTKGNEALQCPIDLAQKEGIFVGGKHIGGATETFDTFNDGELQTLLGQNGVGYNQGVNVGPYSLLPTWLHPR